jgi:TetR/AcrR family transcriptional regulator, cholesterol catabolism regulator
VPTVLAAEAGDADPLTATRRGGRQTATEIRESAIRLFSEFGFQATTQRRLAAAAGINVSSLYNHIDSKHALLSDVMSDIMLNLVEEMEQAIAVDGTPVDRLRAAVQFHVKYHARRADEVFIGNSELRSLTPPDRHRVVALRDRYEGILERLVSDGVASGDFGDCDTRLVVYAVVAIGAHVASWYRADGRRSLDEIASLYADFIVRGLVGDTPDLPTRLLLDRARVDRLLEGSSTSARE